MSTKFVRFVAALAAILGVVGNSGIARADRGAPPSVSAQNLQPPRAPQPLDRPAFNIPSASSLGVQFVHVATAANILSHSTVIDHPLTNSHANAIILVTPNKEPGGVDVTYDDHPIGVFYDNATNRWRIFNQDDAAMPVGAAFNVIIPTASAGVFVHTATSGNTYYDTTEIDNTLTNGNPNAILLATPNWNPDGAGGMNDNHRVGVYYAGSKWAIFNQDGGSMPVGTAFNVFVLTAGAGVFIQTATVNNSAGYTVIDNPLTNNNPNAIVFTTPNLNPGDGSATWDDHNIDVQYNVNRWIIHNQDSAAMQSGTAFNVLVLVPASDIFVHTTTAGNTASASTYVDNALTNQHSNAIVFTTLNWNPGGVGGMKNNHNSGVSYDGNELTIFNQDSMTMPFGAAFNVLVPNPDTSVFVHTATAANTAASDTTIDYPLTNGHPNAIILATPNWNPGGVGGTNDNHPIGVYYQGGQWKIRNQDFVAMPVGAAFNVSLPTAGAGVGVFVHTATAGNSAANLTYINNALTNGNPNAIILVTPNFDPGNACACVPANFPIGVGYDSTTKKWLIFSQNGAPDTMPVGAAFNVYVFANYKVYLPLVLKNF